MMGTTSLWVSQLALHLCTAKYSAQLSTLHFAVCNAAVFRVTVCTHACTCTTDCDAV